MKTQKKSVYANGMGKVDMSNYTNKVCKSCGADFHVLATQIRPGHPHNFCSQTCVVKSDVAKKRMSATAKANPNRREKNQRGSKNANYKGGYHDKHGYKLIMVDGKAVPEHRHVMAGIIGRELTDKETVHHKNGIRDDNTPSNLELWASRNPRGQRPQDMIRWAIEYLEDHGYMVTPSHAGFVEGLLYGAELIHH